MTVALGIAGLALVLLLALRFAGWNADDEGWH